MASKRQRSSPSKPRQQPGRILREEVERLIASGKYKEALKEAKLCYQVAATPDHHHLLERAYFLRADQLQRDRMTGGAYEVARQLQNLGVTDPGLVEDAARLFVSLGLTRGALALQDRLESPEQRDRLIQQAVDQSVAHPEEVPAESADLRRDAELVRAALEAREAGDEPRVHELLATLPRSSPLADWKLLVRGLLAFDRDDLKAARDNWERLAPDERRSGWRRPCSV